MLQRSGANVGRGPPGNYRAASGSCRCLARRRAARARATAIQASHTVAGTAMPPVHGSAAPMCIRKAVSAVAASMNRRKWVSQRARLSVRAPVMPKQPQANVDDRSPTHRPSLPVGACWPRSWRRL
jgi:hypothetical protein